MKNAQAGDRAAVEQIIERVRPQLEGLAREYVSRANAAESVSDLLQEASLRIWQRLGQFRGGENDIETNAKFRAWALQVVRTVGLNAIEIRNAQRRRAPGELVAIGAGSEQDQLGSDLADSAPSPSTEARDREKTEAVKRALLEVPSVEGRDIVKLCIFDGLSFREVGKKLGLTYEQVRGRYHDALRVLETELKGTLF